MDLSVEIPLIVVSLVWLVVGGVIPFVIPKVSFAMFRTGDYVDV